MHTAPAAGIMRYRYVAPRCYKVTGAKKERPDVWVKDPTRSIVLQAGRSNDPALMHDRLPILRPAFQGMTERADKHAGAMHADSLLVSHHADSCMYAALCA